MASLRKPIQLFVLDVDGVLTDGGIYVTEHGEEFRRYNVKDGLGMKQLQAKGIPVVIISSSSCSTIVHRMHALGMNEVYIGVPDKLEKLKEICSARRISPDHICFMGDDLPDIPLMTYVGLACAPSDAIEEVKQLAAIITKAAGGMGCVREICDLLILENGSN